ncbi:MAG: hypothetical protein J0M26_04905 [Planctomycetes bacterium]|nr:hypothetical protein [Planctomycetota bacterium]
MKIEPFPLSCAFENAFDFQAEAGSVYLSGRSVEDRSHHSKSWQSSRGDVSIIDVLREESERIEVGGAISCEIPLRSNAKLKEFWNSVPSGIVYLDITGLKHGTWASLLRGYTGRPERRLRVVYVEPLDYRMSPRPTQNEIYDLSDKIEGIKPLPGFARFRRSSGVSVFAPLLGFEGARLLYLLNQLEPPGQFVFPVIGVPGFRLEYPFETYWANRTALRESQAWKKVLLAPANCPFATLSILEWLLCRHASSTVTVAHIGTKPQALAAIVCALRNPDRVEIVYDHPVRKAKRTEGLGRLHIYEVTGLLNQ